MNARHRWVGGAGIVLLGFFVMATVRHTEAGHGRTPPPSMQRPGVPAAGRPLYLPPAFTDRSAPISERPFAKPFIDRSPSMAERPLPPIGSGQPSWRDTAPVVWCQGRWMRADQLWSGCPSW
jgi:hypothetical protein